MVDLTAESFRIVPFPEIRKFGFDVTRRSLSFPGPSKFLNPFEVLMGG